MNRNRRTVIAAASFSLLGLIALVVGGARADVRKGELALPEKAAPVPAVQLTEARSVTVSAKGEVTGQLQPAKGLQLGFEVSGRLKELLVRKGAPVAEGQLIARLDAELADAQVAQAEAALKVAEAQSTLAADGARRQKELLASKSASDWQATSAEGQAESAAAQAELARAQLAQSRAARKKLDLRAPFSGVLVDAPDQVGTTVAPGVPIFTLEQLDPLTLKVTVSDADRSQVRLGAKVRVESVGSGISTEDAVVKSVIPSADAQTKRVPVELMVPNRGGRFTAHTLGRALLPLGEQVQALAVAASALASTGGDHVFVVAEGGEVRRVAVTVIERGAKEVVFTAGEPLKRVVDYPAVDLAQGTKVSVR